MSKLTGTPLKPDKITPKTAYEMGVILAKLHSQKAQAFGDLINPASLTKCPKIPFIVKFEEAIAECSGQLSRDILERCQKRFTQQLPLLNEPEGPCLIHRDYRPGNILIAHETVQGVIDWASARAGFAEEDFSAFNEIPWPHPPFLEGYASIRPVPDYQPLLPLLRLNKAIASIGFTIKQGSWNRTDSAFYQRQLKILHSVLA